MENDITFKALMNYGCDVAIYENQKLYRYRNEGFEKAMYSDFRENDQHELNPFLKGKNNENKKRVRK